MLDLIIIGGGPGAVQMAIKLQELKSKYNCNIEYMILESESVLGSTFKKYPVHGRLISNNKLYTGSPHKSEFSERFDWNSLISDEKNILARNYSTEFYPSRDIIPSMLAEFKDAYDLPVQYGESCIEIRKLDEYFEIETPKNVYQCKYAVVATGYTLSKPNIKGIEHATPYDRMKHKSYYRDKSVFIVGKGNSGLECANEIMNEANMVLLASPESIKFAFESHYVGSPRLTNCIPIENYQLKHQAAILDCKVLEIQKREDKKFSIRVSYMHAQNEEEIILADEVIYCTGFVSNLPRIAQPIERVFGGYPKLDGSFESSTIKGLFFAGAITHGLDFKKHSSSGFIHGFRYNSLILAENIFTMITGISMEKTLSNIDIFEYIFNRLNNSAAIYLQPGFVGIHLLYKSNTELIYKGLITKQAFKELPMLEGEHILLTLEYGDINSFNNTLSIERIPGDPANSVHIHPVITVKGRHMNKEIILEENLFNKFDQSDVNISIVKEFINSLNTEMLVGE